MHRSSRRTPTPSPAHPSATQHALLWCVCLCSLGGLLVLSVHHPIGTGALIMLAFLGGVWGMRREAARLGALAAVRKSESICGFARSFDLRCTDPLVVRVVYEQIQLELANCQQAFPVKASDHLDKDLGFDDDALDMVIIPAVAARTGRLMDCAASNPYYGCVATVSDLIHFFNCQPERTA